MSDLQALIEDFVIKLKRRQIDGSLHTARKTAELLRQVVSVERRFMPTLAAGLLDAIKAVGARLTQAKPLELAIGNVVRRALHIVREEQLSIAREEAENSDPSGGAQREAAVAAAMLQTPSLVNLLEAGTRSAMKSAAAAPSAEDVRRRQNSFSSPSASTSSDDSKGRKPQWKLKHNVIERLNELIDEVEQIHLQIAEQAIEHIHANEVILTMGRSRTVSYFLREAAKKRTFQVVVAEGAPRYEGQAMARQLASSGIQTTCITDSAVFAMMARVIATTHAVMANGGVIAPVGLHMVALAAKQHAVPFVILAGLHKLSPIYPHDPDTTLNDIGSPADIIDYDALTDCLYAEGFEERAQLHVANPAFDYIPPHLISLFITDTGGHNPSYVYRLLAEYYSPEDYAL
eukprot:jgi/Chlat1/3472/Chrsp23S03674